MQRYSVNPNMLNEIHPTRNAMIRDEEGTYVKYADVAMLVWEMQKVIKISDIPPTTTALQLLADLHTEMIKVHSGKLVFDQELCDVCVIGNGVRAGLFDAESKTRLKGGNFNSGHFEQIVDSINLEDTERKYLFGSTRDIKTAAATLDLPIHADIKHADEYLTSLDACMRIETILKRHGYDVSTLQQWRGVETP